MARERYDLIIPRAFPDDPKVRAVRAVIGTDGFSGGLLALGGYETHLTGRIMRPGMGLGE